MLPSSLWPTAIKKIVSSMKVTNSFTTRHARTPNANVKMAISATPTALTLPNGQRKPAHAPHVMSATPSQNSMYCAPIGTRTRPKARYSSTSCVKWAINNTPSANAAQWRGRRHRRTGGDATASSSGALRACIVANNSPPSSTNP